MTKGKTPRDRLEALALATLDRLEADARRGKVPSASELNGTRRCLSSIEKERSQAEHLEHLRELTRD